MRGRDPVFSTSDVRAAQRANRAQQQRRAQELRADEKKRWEHLVELQTGVLQRPLLME